MPGSGKQPAEVQAQIKELLEAGFDPTTIHRKLKVGRSSIYRMKRCLEQHGTNYMPAELNKKNGRPKVLTSEQELEILNWLRTPGNRNRYLDDLVWFTHDRFGIVCSTTTMSKLKRKWLRVIEQEELGRPIDDAECQQIDEAHAGHSVLPDVHISAQQAQGAIPPEAHMQSHHVDSDFQQNFSRLPEQSMMRQGLPADDHPHDPQIDSRLEQQIQIEITAAAAAAAMEAQENHS